MKDLRCYSLHFYYRIQGSDLFYGEDGFSTCSAEECTKDIENITIEKFKKLSDGFRKVMAEQCEVPLENIIPISRKEYIENTEEDS